MDSLRFMQVIVTSLNTNYSVLLSVCMSYFAFFPFIPMITISTMILEKKEMIYYFLFVCVRERERATQVCACPQRQLREAGAARGVLGMELGFSGRASTLNCRATDSPATDSQA